MVLPMMGLPGGMPGGMPDAPPEPDFLALESLSPEMLALEGGEPVTNREKKPKRKKPSPGEIQQMADRLLGYWKPRDQRMDEDEALYLLARHYQRDTKLSGELITRNMPYVVVEKAANMLGRVHPNIEKVAPRDDLRETAQKVEDALRSFVDEWVKVSQRAGRGNLRRSLAHYAALRGWVTARVSYNAEAANDECPVRLFVADPRHVYPSFGTYGLRYVIYRARRTIGQVLDEWPHAAEIFKGGEAPREDTERVEIIAYYDDWWHGVVIDGVEVRQVTAHEYGFVPWVIGIANGSPIQEESDHHTPEMVAQTGPSLFHGAKPAYQQMNKILSQLATEVAKASDPPTIYYYDPEDGELPQKLDLSPGSQNFLVYNKERAEALRTTPGPAEAQAVLNALLEDIHYGSLPPVLWGAGAQQSGFAVSLMSGAARDALFGIQDTLENFYEEVFEYALRLICDFHDQPVGIIVKDAQGRWVGGATVDYQDIQQVGFKTEVTFQDVAPKDQAMMAQLGAMLTDKKLISLQTAREKYLGIENAERENQRVVEDLIYMDEEIVREILNPLTLFKNNPDLFEAWAAMKEHQRRVRSEERASETGGMPPVEGMPPGPVPAPLGPEPFDALEQARGAAAGGADFERPEGVGGIGGLLPGGLGVPDY